MLAHSTRLKDGYRMRASNHPGFLLAGHCIRLFAAALGNLFFKENDGSYMLLIISRLRFPS